MEDRMTALELNERRSHGWPKFNPTKESFRSFIQRVNEHANATMRTEADALRALPTMLSEEYLEAYRAGINANDTWRTILDKIRDAVLTPAKCSEFQAKLSALSQGGLSVQEFAKQIKEAANMAYPASEQTRDSVALMTFLKGLRRDIRQDVRKSSPATLADAIRIASTNEAILAMGKDEENHQLVNAVALLTESVRKLNTREDNNSQFRRYEDRKSHSRDQSKDRDRDQKPNRWKKNSYQSNRDQGNQERRRPHYQRRNYRQSNGDEEYSEHRQRNQSRDNYGRGRSQGRNRGNHFTNFLFATVVIAAALIQPSTAIDHFDCTKTTGGILIRPPTPTNCTTDSPTSEIVIREIQLWIWKPKDQVIEGHRCTREIYRRCTDSLLYVSSFNQSLSRIEAVTAQQCRTMIAERRSGNLALNRVDAVTFATSLEEEAWPERTILSTTCKDVHRDVLQKGPVSQFEDKILSPLLLNTNSCLYEDGICGNEAAIVLWKVPELQGCKQVLVATHTAQVTESTVLIPTSQSAFRLSSEETPTSIQKCFNQKVYMTTSSVMITFTNETPKTRRKRSNEAYNVLERFLEQRIHLPQLTLRQFERARNQLPQLIAAYNITEYEIEKHIRLHPSKDISLGIIHAIVNAEIMEARKKKFHYPTITFADTPIDYSTTEAESWISLAKIMFREIKDPFITELHSNPTTTIKPQPAKSYIGSAGHVNYLKAEYDKREEHLRNISSMSQNAKSQYKTEVIQDDQRRNFAQISKMICQTNNRQLQIWEALLKVDPTVGMRALLQRPDSMAHFVGSKTLLVAQCSKVEATEVIRSRRIGEVCFVQTPILTSTNKTLFIVTGSRDVTTNSRQIPCEEVSPEIYETDNGKISILGEEHTVNEIKKINRLNTSITSLDFTAGEILQPAMKSSFPLSLAISFGEHLQSLQYQKKSLLKPTTIDKFIKGQKKNLEQIATMAGYTFNATTNTIVETLEEFKDFYKEYMIIVGSVLSVLGILALGGYIIFKMALRSFGIFNVNTMTEEDAGPSEEISLEPQSYEEAVKPFLPRLPPLMTYLPILMTLVNSVAATALPYVPIVLKDRITCALWDSGSSISYMRRSTLLYINEHNFSRTYHNATTANGTSFSFLGSATIPVRIGNTSVEMKFLISEDSHCPASVLLGYDFMRLLEENGVQTTLLPGQKKIIIGKSLVPLIKKGERIYQDTKRTVNIVAVNNAELAPGKSTTLKITFDCKEPIHLRPSKKSPLRFNECIIDPWLKTKRKSPSKIMGTKDIASRKAIFWEKLQSSRLQGYDRKKPTTSTMETKKAEHRRKRIGPTDFRSHQGLRRSSTMK